MNAPGGNDKGGKPRPQSAGLDMRIGQIVPSSNTTMETEIPAILRKRELIRPNDRFTFHSSRMRMKQVTRDELAAMDADSLRCAAELADAAVDVVGYACLVAIMSMGHGYHCVSQTALQQRMSDEGHPAPVVTSAGALVDELKLAGIRSIALIAPYMPDLTAMVVDYISQQGIRVVDSICLSIQDNLEVGRRDPMALPKDVERLNTSGADLVVLSACVQMPSLQAIPIVEQQLGMPVTSAAACTTRAMLRALQLEPIAPDAGFILSEANKSAASFQTRADGVSPTSIRT